MAQVLDFKDLGRRLSNWGRWGEDDELGTLNFVTAETRVAAAALVRTGKVFDLGMPLNDRGPQPGGIRINPTRRMTVTPADYVDSPGGIVAADDVVVMSLQCATQWDSLAHVGYDGYLYNGVPDSAVNSFGASKNSIDRTIERLAGRGVLLDVARLKGVERMGAGEPISADDLTAAAERQGVEVRSGDILFVRTGWYQMYLEADGPTFLGSQPGLDLSCCEWLHEREVAAIAMDNVAIEVLPSEIDGIETPLHAVLIRDMGLTLGEMFQLEDLAADCEQDGVWEFLFAGPPLKFTSAVGSPLSPLAFK